MRSALLVLLVALTFKVPTNSAAALALVTWVIDFVGDLFAPIIDARWEARKARRER